MYEPVYEASFDEGYLPVFALDVSAGQSYQAILCEVDEDGSYLYGPCQRTFYCLKEWGADWTEETKGQLSHGHTEQEIRAAGGGDFLDAYDAWTAGLYQTDPAESTQELTMGIDDGGILEVETAYPPFLEVSPDPYLSEDSYLTANGFVPVSVTEYIYPQSGDTGVVRFLRSQDFYIDIPSLLQAETVTAALLQQAAVSIADFDWVTDSAYDRTDTWYAALPDALGTQWNAVSASLAW